MDDALDHVDGSRYALVHAVSKRARQITLWLTADPAELRAEAAPPPAPGELVSRDPVALAEAEILQGEVRVQWDPDGVEDRLMIEEPVETDPLLIEGIAADEDDDEVSVDLETSMTPALAQALGAEADEVDEDVDDDADDADDGATLAVDDDEDDDDLGNGARRGRRAAVVDEDVDIDGDVDIDVDDEADDVADEVDEDEDE